RGHHPAGLLAFVGPLGARRVLFRHPAGADGRPRLLRLNARPRSSGRRAAHSGRDRTGVRADRPALQTDGPAVAAARYPVSGCRRRQPRSDHRLSTGNAAGGRRGLLAGAGCRYSASLAAASAGKTTGITHLRIAIDASRTTSARVTGTERYALQLTRALIDLDSTHHFWLYFRDTPPPDLFPCDERVVTRLLRQPRLWTHTAFAAALWRDRPDVTFVPAHSLPLIAPGRMAVTVHDLGFRYFPEAHPWWPRLYLHLS